VVIFLVVALAIWGWFTRRRAKREPQDGAHVTTTAHVPEDEQQPAEDQVQPYGPEPRSDPHEERRQQRRER
jgi:hypothetical protein